ncbi:hypothetical protein Ddye_015813 [Dipteronia dyeriana]|uniref:Transposase n=1 Tax=Dipteronia dyeriana TaxID=168575 RepID=A0AAD9U658_9ROSI|nr:hypothetical protein Ddye_015813 [Dipteronia dyeriana]
MFSFIIVAAPAAIGRRCSYRHGLSFLLPSSLLEALWFVVSSAVVAIRRWSCRRFCFVGCSSLLRPRRGCHYSPWFMYVSCPHNAENLSDALMECLLDWNIDRKLSTLTPDNCSTNNSMIDLLLARLSQSALIVNGRLFHMRCVAYNLNLIVKSGLDVIESRIERICDSVAFWTATPKRMEKFEEATEQLNLGHSQKNSTHLMLNVALTYKDVFYCFKQRDSQYRTIIKESDWDLAKEMCDKLKIFYSVTKTFSSTKYLTSNLFFPKICEIKLSLRKWLSSCFIEISSMASNMIVKFDQYWNNVHGVLTMASLLDPRFKLKLPQYFFPLNCGEYKAEDEVKKVSKLCEVIFLESQARVCEKHSQEVRVICSSDFSIEGERDSLDGFLSWNSEISDVNEKSKLDCYLEEKTLPMSHGFDILGWLKFNGIKYPIMSEIARDILAIPISTIALECSCSTSGRIVSTHRNRLQPSTLEVIMCTQNWLWTGKKDNIVDGVGDVQVDDDNDNEMNETANASK